jgi:hypothetical protein
MGDAISCPTREPEDIGCEVLEYRHYHASSEKWPFSGWAMRLFFGVETF